MKKVIILLMVSLFSNIQFSGQDCFALNFSYLTDCAEEDNINIPIYGDEVLGFKIVATHPTDSVELSDCDPNFDSCMIGPGGFPDQCSVIYDDGTNVIKTCMIDNWWRDTTMGIELPEGLIYQAHYLVLIKKIQDQNSWPEFFVLYQDGNLRLIPHPPVHLEDVCYGSSVIVGPAEEDSIRPYIEIDKIEIDPSTFDLSIAYKEGGSADLNVSVNRDSAVVDVTIDYPIDAPVATFRSMWVEDGNCDVDHIAVGNDTIPIMSNWDTLSHTSFFFHRKFPSIHNNSAPDIRIDIDKLINSVNPESLQENDILIFPNPARETIAIKSETGVEIDVVEIYNINGVFIKKFASGFDAISLNNLASGVYLIKVIKDNRAMLKRITKL